MDSSKAEDMDKLLQLSDEKIDEILQIIKKLWETSDIIIGQHEETGWSSAIYAPSLKKYSVEGIDNLSKFISRFLRLTEFIVGETNDGDNLETIEEYVPSEEKKRKLKIFLNKIKNFEFYPEIDYKIHGTNPIFDTRLFRSSTNTYETAHFKKKLPVANIRFYTNMGGIENQIHMELTKTDINDWMIKLKELKDELENMNK